MKSVASQQTNKHHQQRIPDIIIIIITNSTQTEVSKSRMQCRQPGHRLAVAQQLPPHQGICRHDAGRVCAEVHKTAGRTAIQVALENPANTVVF